MTVKDAIKIVNTLILCEVQWSEYTNNKSQRDELAYRLLNGLEACIPVYDYDEGFPPDVSPTELGCLEVEDLKLQIILVFPELVDTLYWRATVSFVATYNQLTQEALIYGETISDSFRGT